MYMFITVLEIQCPELIVYVLEDEVVGPKMRGGPVWEDNPDGPETIGKKTGLIRQESTNRNLYSDTCITYSETNQATRALHSTYLEH